MMMGCLSGPVVIDLWLCVRDSLHDFIKVAVQGFTDQVQVFQVDPVHHFMVNLIDRGGSDACAAGEIGLCPAHLTQFSG